MAKGWENTAAATPVVVVRSTRLTGSRTKSAKTLEQNISRTSRVKTFWFLNDSPFTFGFSL